ncbi:MAG: diguanylate cyclase [Woeseia sp.]
MHSPYISFLDAMADRGLALPTEYSPALVLLSYLIAAVASSVALLIAWRLRNDLAGYRKTLWLSLGALTMGMGIWAMHFVGMLAIRLPLPVAYNVPTTVWSVVPAIGAAGLCLAAVSRKRVGAAWLLGGGVAMGLGIGAMHYIGMAAMRVHAEMLYEPALFALSIAVAPILAIAALYSVLWTIKRRPANPTWALALSGAIMGLAVALMHYTGMWAVAYFPVDASEMAPVDAGIDSAHLAILVAAAVSTIIALAVAAARMDYRINQLKAAATTEAEKFENLLEVVPDGIIGVNDKGQMRFLNSRVEALFGYTRDQMIGKPVEMLIPARFAEAHERHQAKYRATPSRRQMGAGLELTGRRADHSEFPTEISLNNIQTGEGPLVVCSIRDVSEQRRAREALREANEKLSAGMALLESQSTELRYLTEMGELLHGCEVEQEAHDIISNVVGKLLPDSSGAVYILSQSRNILQSTASWGPRTELLTPIFSPNDCWALRRGRMYSSENRQSAVRCKHAGDEYSNYVCIPMLAQGDVLGVLHVFASCDDVAGDGGTEAGFLAPRQIVVIAIAEQIGTAIANLRLREELRNQSIRDQLTGLLNRRFMEESLDREILRAARMGTQLSIVAFDLDHFKRFNDNFGHEGGDVVLREIGALLLAKCRDDDLPCRLGGEELLLILPDTSLEDAQKAAEKLRQRIEKLSLLLRGQSLGKVTASFGVATYPLHGATHQDVLRAADRALYQAKAAGRNCVLIATQSDDTSANSMRTLVPETELPGGAT